LLFWRNRAIRRARARPSPTDPDRLATSVRDRDVRHVHRRLRHSLDPHLRKPGLDQRDQHLDRYAEGMDEQRDRESLSALRVDRTPTRRTEDRGQSLSCCFYWRSLGDSNPCFRRERATSWAARRREPDGSRNSPERVPAQALVRNPPQAPHQVPMATQSAQ
jgi:hypothetical protein